MKHWRSIVTLFKKEVVEGFRDKKTLFTNYVLPLVLFPLMLILGGEAISSQILGPTNQNYKIYAIGDHPIGILDHLKQSKKIEFVSLASKYSEKISELIRKLPNEASSKSALLKILKEQKLSAILDLQPLATRESQLSSNDNHYHTYLYYDNADSNSLFALDYLSAEIVRSVTELRSQRLKSIGLGEQYIIPFILNREGLGDQKAFVKNFLGSTILYFLLIILTLSAFYPALNSTAGEREQGTLSALLGTTIESSTLVYGKFLAVLFSSLAGLFAYLLSSSLCLFVMKQSRFQLPQGPNSLLLLPLVILSAASLVSTATLFVGFLSRKKSEGQAFLSFLMLGILSPAFVALTTEVSLSPLIASIPLLNLALIAKHFATDAISPHLLVLALISNLIWTYGLLKLSAEVLKSEYAGDISLSDLLTFDRNIIRFPTPALSMIIYFTLLGFSLYLNLALSRSSFFIVIPITQLGVFLAIPIFFSKYFNLNTAEVFHLKAARRLALFGSLVLSSSVSILILTLLHLGSLFDSSAPGLPKEVVDDIEKRFHIAGSSPSLSALLVLTAFLPGICEELAFRGVILSGLLKRFSPYWAILLSSVMFGINHFSLIRFLPTTFVGLLLGFSVWRSKSVFPAILIHIIYNASIMSAAKYPGFVEKVFSFNQSTYYSVTVGSIAFLALGLALVSKRDAAPKAHL